MRAGTWAVVAAVLLIVGAAAADAVRDIVGREAAAAPADDPAAVALADDTVAGVLYYTDEFCSLRAIRLPGGAEAEAPAWSGCGASLSPDGLTAAPSGTRWAPRGRLRVSGSGGLLQVFSRGEPVSGPLVASAPAFRPDGTLTYFRHGRVVTWQGDRVLLRQRRLRAAVRRALGPVVVPVEVRELGWLTNTRVVAVLAVGERSDVLAVFDTEGVVAAWPGTGEFGRVWPSPRGTRFVVETDALLLFDRDGRQLPAPRLPQFRGAAWSPDERWLAVATPRRVLVLAMQGPPRAPLRLEVEAQDVFWRLA